jgi:hypothetical protein
MRTRLHHTRHTQGEWRKFGVEPYQNGKKFGKQLITIYIHYVNKFANKNPRENLYLLIIITLSFHCSQKHLTLHAWLDLDRELETSLIDNLL